MLTTRAKKGLDVFRALWASCWAGLVLNFAGIIGLWIVSALTDNEDPAQVGGILIIPLVAGFIGMMIWEDYGVPEKSLPRAERKELKKVEARMRLEQRIEQLESELRNA